MHTVFWHCQHFWMTCYMKKWSGFWEQGAEDSQNQDQIAVMLDDSHNKNDIY